MKKYFIHRDDQQQGPFSIDELKRLIIHRDTMVWFEGVDNWQKAEDVDELKDIFKSIPPNFKSNSTQVPPPFNSNASKKLSSDIGGDKLTTKRIRIIAAICVLLLIAFGTYMYLNQQAKMQDQIQAQNTELQNQNSKIQEQDQIESDRKAAAIQQQNAINAAQRQQALAKLKYQYDEAVTNLRASKLKLRDIQSFHFLRLTSDKEQQVRQQLEIIRAWENQVAKLKTTIDQY